MTKHNKLSIAPTRRYWQGLEMTYEVLNIMHVYNRATKTPSIKAHVQNLRTGRYRVLKEESFHYLRRLRKGESAELYRLEYGYAQTSSKCTHPTRKSMTIPLNEQLDRLLKNPQA